MTLKRIVCALIAIAVLWYPAEPAGQTSETRIAPFTIRIPDAALSDLKARLQRPRFPPALQGDWTYGTDLAYLKELVTYWRDKFDWRAQERKLNQFEHFTTNIDGLNIHFIHR